MHLGGFDWNGIKEETKKIPKSGKNLVKRGQVESFKFQNLEGFGPNSKQKS